MDKQNIRQCSLTSRQDLPAVLQRQRRQTVLLIDPDHSVTQTRHTEHAPSRGVGSPLSGPPHSHRHRLTTAGTWADRVRPETFRLEHAQELVTRAERPRVGAVCHQEQPQGGEVDVLVVLGGEQAPVQVPGFDDRDARWGRDRKTVSDNGEILYSSYYFFVQITRARTF